MVALAAIPFALPAAPRLVMYGETVHQEYPLDVRGRDIDIQNCRFVCHYEGPALIGDDGTTGIFSRNHIT